MQLQADGKSLGLQNPRRIFRSNAIRGGRRVGGAPVPQAVTAGVLGAVVGAALMLLVAPAELFGRAPPPVGEISADATQTAVVDGETLRLHETVVRLLGVAAPLRGQLCRHADGGLFDCGAASAEALAHLVGDHRVDCRLLGRDDNGQAIAVCEADGRELNHAQVTDGWARARAENAAFGASSLGGPSLRAQSLSAQSLSASSLSASEAEARNQHRGLWAGRFDPQS